MYSKSSDRQDSSASFERRILPLRVFSGFAFSLASQFSFFETFSEEMDFKLYFQVFVFPCQGCEKVRIAYGH